MEAEPQHLDIDQLITLLNYVLEPVREDDPVNEYTWGYAAGIVFASFYAMRRSEIYGIRWADIDWEKNIVQIENALVRVKRQLEKRPKSKASRAPMPLMPFVKSFLYRLKEYQRKCTEFYGQHFDENDYICCRKADGSRFGLGYLNNRLAKDLTILGIQPVITQHELRHSTATLLRSLGFAEQEIQSWLRHADLDTTMHYAHDSIKVRMRASKVLNSVFRLECIPHDSGQEGTYGRIAV